MTPHDIKVGVTYYRDLSPNVFLGCGKRTMWKNDLTNKAPMDEKFLVIIGGEEEFIGLVVKPPGECIPNYWDGFIEDKSTITLWLGTLYAIGPSR